MYKFQSVVTNELKENLREKVSEILTDFNVVSAGISVEYEDGLERVNIELVYVPDKVTE